MSWDSNFNFIKYLVISNALPLILDSTCFIINDGLLKLNGKKLASTLPLLSIQYIAIELALAKSIKAVDIYPLPIGVMIILSIL